MRQEREGLGVRLLTAPSVNMVRLKAFLRQCALVNKAPGQQTNMSARKQSDEAGSILDGLMRKWLPAVVDSLQDALLNRLWESCDTAPSDAERMVLMGDIAMLSQAVREQRLLETIQRELLFTPKFEDDELPGSQREEDERILELVDTERFEVWLASAALANKLEEKLREPLGQIHQLAVSAFGPNVQLPVDPQSFSTALETALFGQELSAFAIALCLREASAELVGGLNDIYAELISGWREVGLVPAPVNEGTTPVRRIESRDESAVNAPVASAPDGNARVSNGSVVNAPAASAPVGDALGANAPAGSASGASAPGASAPGASASTGNAPLETGSESLQLESAESSEALSNWLFSLPPSGGGETGVPTDVKKRLTDLLSSGLESEPGAKARLSERVDTTNRLLANMVQDSHAPSAVKQLIKQLATKFLALALADAGFFRDASHPIVGIVDQLEQLNTLVPGSVQLRRLVEKTSATDVRDREKLGSISAEIGDLLDRHAGALQRNAERLVASLEGKERLREARSEVRGRLNRTFAGQMVHKAIVRLIDEGWRALLELAALRQGSDSPAWTRYWETLLGAHCCTGGTLPGGCSSALERKALDASLRAGLEYIGFNSLHRGSLLAIVTKAMDAVHAQPLNREEFVRFSEIPSEQDRKPRLAQRPKEISVEEWDDALEQVDRLAVGSQLELDQDGSKSGRRLVWRSADGTQLVFTDGLGKNVRGLRREQLATVLSQGKAKIEVPTELGITGRAVDATLEQIHERIADRQQRDPLTGLSTRNQLIGELGRFISSDPEVAEPTAFGCMSPDHFEELIGNSGYAAGDQLLQTIAKRLKNFLREAVCVAYMGGSRFGFLVPAQDSLSAQAIGEDVRSTLAKFPFIWNRKPYPVATSLGLTLVSGSDSHPEILLAAADTACTAARKAGGDRVILFRETDEAIARQRAAVEGWIKAEEVVRSKRIRLRCQTIAATDPAEKQPHHHEILLSVFDEAGEGLPLMDFINSAEAFNRMGEVDRLVVEKALSWVHENPESAARLGGIAINLSGQSLGDERILGQIREALESLQIDPKMIGFEVTETAAIGNLDRAVAIIEGIRSMGCRFSLDDFGTGLSSYGYLKRLPVDYLKIDGSFVREILSSPTDEAIVKSINEIAHFMGIKTIAEFVCEEQIRERLLEIGVDYVQGYAVSKPVYLDEIELSS